MKLLTQHPGRAAVLVGERDPAMRLYVAPLQRLRQDWPVVTIEQAGHRSAVTTRQFATELRHWLDRNRGR